MNPAAALLRELRQRRHAGGLARLKAFLAPYKAIEPEPIVCFEIPRGKQMQANSTVVRRGRDALLALVATLGYSRATLRACSRLEDFGALRDGLIAAFEYFGGVFESMHSLERAHPSTSRTRQRGTSIHRRG